MISRQRHMHGQFQESQHLEEAIKSNLEALGYGG